MSAKESAKNFKPKYYLKYIDLDDSGDYRPYMVWEEETFEEINELARFILNKKRYGHDEFEVIEIMELSKFEDYELLERAKDKDEIRYQEELRKTEERNKRVIKQVKEREEKERYELYLKLKERYENQ